MASNLTIYNRFIAAGSSSNQIYQACLTAGSSSQDATETAYPPTTQANFTYSLQTTLSNVTPTASVFNPDLYKAGKNAVTVSRVEDNFSGSYYKPVTIPANTSLNQIIDDRIAADISITSLKDGSQSPTFNSVKASSFSTTLSNGNILISGDDAIIKDVNIANAIGIIGQQNTYRGWVKFGKYGPLVGHNGNQATPLPGDGLYAITGSLLVSGSHLFMYTGCVTGSGWDVII
jgi:hypothetical protein